MSAPTTHDPLVVNTADGVTWLRRAVTSEGRGLYAVTDSCKCPEYLMATLAELAEHGIAGSADVLPMPVGPDADAVRLALFEEELQTTARLRLALESAQRGRRELRARVAELEAGRAAVLDDFIARCEVALSGCCSECDAAAAVVKGRKQAALDNVPVPEWSADRLTALLAPSQTLREDEPAAKCRCDEPGADPYSCEADDCSGHFSELNPFGGGPVQGHDAKVSRTCTCGWRTTVWHVADGSAEEELHGHIVRVHGGVAPEVSR